MAMARAGIVATIGLALIIAGHGTTSVEGAETAGQGADSRRSGVTSDFALGKRLGDLLASGGMVFVGDVTQIDAAAKQSSSLNSSSVVGRGDLVHIEPIEWMRSSESDRRASVAIERPTVLASSALSKGEAIWTTEEVRPGSRVIVGCWASGKGAVAFGRIVEAAFLVVQSERVASAVRELIGEYGVLEKTARISSELRASASSTDQLALGFLVALTGRPPEVLDQGGREAAARVAADLIDNEAVPDAGKFLVIRGVAGSFSPSDEGVSSLARRELLAALVRLSASNEETSAQLGIRNLVYLESEYQLDIGPIAGGEVRERLARNYRQAVDNGVAPRSPGLESQLGITLP